MSQFCKILYVSDLDGTLLRSNERTSDFTNSVINSLVAKGMCFSYATARSFITASKTTKGLYANIPVIVYNGAIILDTNSNEIMLSNFFIEEEVNLIKKILVEKNVYPIVYSFINNIERFTYRIDMINDGMQVFLDSRKGDIRENPVENIYDLYSGQTFYFTCIDSEDKLKPIYDQLKQLFNCIFHKDIYSGNQWLEILPINATKANAILQLKKHMGCERVISFGDGKNDISMFKISDECYAVRNAVAELKKMSTGIIDDNNSDGVARWLRENVIL